MKRTIERIITGRKTSDGAGVQLSRVLGQDGSSRMDPFLMLDEFGSDQAEDYLSGFPDHPHRGFETVTIMLEGRMLHQDHLGNRGLLEPGSVQWMTAGSGVIHSEMPQQLSGRMRGFQLWVNLPAAEKMKPAAYQEFAAQQIPVARLDETVTARVIAGRVESQRGVVEGPVTGISVDPMVLDLDLSEGAKLVLPVDTEHSCAIYVYEGQLEIEGQIVQAGQAALLGSGESVDLKSPGSSRVLLLAARPIGEPIVQHGPFVMNTREEIQQAMDDYRTGRLTQNA
jgi:redox-sensitive bicupin YhaK (pirin superfamily)